MNIVPHYFLQKKNRFDSDYQSGWHAKREFEPLLPQKFFYVISNTNLKFFHRRWKGVLIDLFNHVSR